MNGNNIDNKQNEILEKFSNFHKYINKLLELSPDYFNGLIKDFNNNFEFIPLDSDDRWDANELEEKILLKSQELKDLLAQINDALINFHDKNESKYSFDKDSSFKDQETKKQYSNLIKMNNIFNNKLVKILEELKNINDSVKDKKPPLVSLETFNKYNNTKIYENSQYLEEIKIIAKKNKKYKIKIFTTLTILFVIIFVIFLILYLK